MVILLAMYQGLTTSVKETRFQLRYAGQAENVARAGLIDAINWFRRQESQPVCNISNPDSAFNPKYSTNTAQSDTIDESIGIVKEYVLSENDKIWARYEVKKQSTGPYDPHAVHDITGERIEGHQNGEGLCWYIESAGYVFIRRSTSVAFNQPPNEIIGRARVATEIRRLDLSLPADAAYFVNDGGSSGSRTVEIFSQGRVIGENNIGCARYSGEKPRVYSGGQVTGSPKYQNWVGPPTCSSIFGVEEDELKNLADYYVNSVSELPSEYPSMALVFIDNSATFDATHKLRGGGILYVNGDLTLESGSNTLFSGLIYVTGKIYIYGPALISGAVVGYEGMELRGAGDVAQIEFDNTILDSVRQQICQYRELRSAYRTFTGIR